MTVIASQELNLKPLPTAPRQARQFAASVLSNLGYPKLCEDAKVIASELVTNALVHARDDRDDRDERAQITVFVGIQFGRPILEVWDSSVRLPTSATPAAEDEHGRGLWIVKALAADVGWTVTPSGKVVWAILK